MHIQECYSLLHIHTTFPYFHFKMIDCRAVEVLGWHFYSILFTKTGSQTDGFPRSCYSPRTPHEASLKVLFEAMTTVVNARFERLSFRPKVAHNSEVCWHCGAAASRRARGLSDELQKRRGSSPQRQAGPHL